MTNYTTKSEYRFYISNMQLWHETEDGDADYQRNPVGNYSGLIVVTDADPLGSFSPEEYALNKAEYELRRSLGEDSPFSGWYGIASATIREESEAEFLTRLGVPSLF
jgi:hypothetical protein